MAIPEEVTETIGVQIPGVKNDCVDHNHPLFIHPPDTQGSVLISIQLLGSENYSLWSKSLKLVLLGKNKLGFLLGTCRKEKYPPYMHDLWERCNAIVLGLIINTVSKGTTSVSNYFSRLRELWDEFETLIPPPSCACPESKQYAEHFKFQKLWQFLMGLNESCAYAKSQVLMNVPVPNANQAYAMIINVESQRMNGASSSSASIEAHSETALMSNRMSHNHHAGNGGYHHGNASSSGTISTVGGSNSYSSNYGSGGGYNSQTGTSNGYRPRNSGDGRNVYGNRKSHVYCEYCHYKGHTKETCYKLHGYPKKKGGATSSHANNAATGGNQQNDTRVYDSSVSPNVRSYVSSASIPTAGTRGFFTPEQYNQILQMLNKGKRVYTMANVATASTTGSLQWEGPRNW